MKNLYNKLSNIVIVGGGSAGGIVAVIIANIVAIFLMRLIGKNLEN